MSSNAASQMMYEDERPLKMGWRQAIRMTFQNKDELGRTVNVVKRFFNFLKLASIYTIPVTFGDDILTPIPGIDVVTASDEVVLVFGLFMLAKVAIFRHQKNRELAEIFQESRRPAHRM